MSYAYGVPTLLEFWLWNTAIFVFVGAPVMTVVFYLAWKFRKV